MVRGKPQPWTGRKGARALEARITNSLYKLDGRPLLVEGIHCVLAWRPSGVL